MSTAEAAAAPQPGDVIGGRYRLGSILGQGGMGTVWRAIHLELGVDVAVKLIPPSLLASPVALTRFKREARAAAALKSPHVVTVHDYGEGAGQPYLVMELLPGEDLRSHLDRVERLDLEAAGTIFTAVCKALRLAHDEGIVHRDLKPGNIFLAKSGDEVIVKVLDFGVAKDLHAAADTVKTASDALIGSPRYMSPEQVRGSHIDHRSDLWSASVVLYEMLVGRHPFSGETMGDVLLKIAMDEIAKPSSIVPQLPQEVDDFFVRALERNADRRFPDATSLAAAFRDVLRAPPRSDATPEPPIGRQDVTADLPARDLRPTPPSSGPAAARDVAAPYSGAALPFAAPDASVLATSRGVGTPDPDATAPALTRKIVGPGSNRRWIFVAIASAMVLGAVAAVAWVPRPDDPERPAASSASAAAAADAPLAAATGTTQPQVVPAPSSLPSAAAAPAASASAAPPVDAAAQPSTVRPVTPPRGAGPAPRPEAGRPREPAPTPTRRVDPIFGVEDEAP